MVALFRSIAVNRPYGGLTGVGNPPGTCRYCPYARPSGCKIPSLSPSFGLPISEVPGVCTGGTQRIPVSGSKPAPFHVVETVPIRWMVPLVPFAPDSRTDGGMKRDP